MSFHYCLKPNIWIKKRELSLQELLAMLPGKIDKNSSVYSIVIVEKILNTVTTEVKKQLNNFSKIGLKEEEPGLVIIKFFCFQPPVIAAVLLGSVYMTYSKLNIREGEMQHIVMIRGP